MPRFDIGKFVMTKGVASEIDNNPNYKMELLDCLTRYLNCDWGNLCDTDKLLNDPIDEYNHLMDALRYATEGTRKRMFRF